MADLNLEMPPVLEGFRRLELLGTAGSYARAYLVADSEDGRFALKLGHVSNDQEVSKRYQNEAWALQHLSHTAVPRFIFASDYEGRPYIVMSYADGQTVEQHVLSARFSSTKESPLRVLSAARALLECLVYLDERGVIHQDIKSDNIIVPERAAGATLIDFGLCHAQGAPEQMEWSANVGAPAFSPPSKLRRPGQPKHKHDVFALGVVFYEWLTHSLPWLPQTGDDPEALAFRMSTSRAAPIRSYNPSVAPEIADFFESLIATSDTERPTAAVALERLVALLEKPTEFIGPRESDDPHFTRMTRVVRDPLHGDIRYTEFEREIINTEAFQRLRKLRQLGTSHYVYPGAEHTRFLHALGTLDTAERVLQRIEQRSGISLPTHDRAVARAYALLHDVSHAPFGHTLEDELGIFSRHDENQRRLRRILAKGTRLGDLLGCSEVGRSVLQLLLEPKAAAALTWIAELVSGPAGADVMDYVDRDAFFCGLDHRVDSAIFRWFALDRLRSGTDTALGDRHVGVELYGPHGFRLDGDLAAIALLRERHALFLKVYSHKMKLAAGAMLGKALVSAINANPDIFSEESIELLGDEQLIALLKSRGGSTAGRLVTMLDARELFVPVYSAPVMSGKLDRATYEEEKLVFDQTGYASRIFRSQFEDRLAYETGAKADDIIFYATPSAPGAQRVSRIVFGGRADKAAERRRNLKHEQIFADHLELWRFFVFASPTLQPGVQSDLASVAASLLGRADTHRGEQLELI